MKIIELIIKDIRGIRNEIKIQPNGENFAVYGPNGTGKSAIVDAIDFLLTGNITRISGRGTQGISLKEYGPHVDAKLEDAVVSAKVLFKGMKEPVLLTRKMSSPNKIEYERQENEDLIKDTLEIAEKGQHILTRSEILKYISAEAGKRSEEIQSILNINTIDDIRKVLVTTNRDADKTKEICKTNYETSINVILPIIKTKPVNDTTILIKINECRKILKGSPLAEIDMEKLKEGLDFHFEDNTKSVSLSDLKILISNTKITIKEFGPSIKSKERDLRNIIRECISDEEIRRDLANSRLLEIGLSLINETESCPLCLREWPPGKLKEFLNERIKRAKRGTELLERISNLSSEIKEIILKQKNNILTLRKIADLLSKKEIAIVFQKWYDSLEKWDISLENVMENYPTEEPEEVVLNLFAPSNWEQLLSELEKEITTDKKISPEQSAWDILTSLNSVLQRYLEEKNQLEHAIKFSEISKLLLDAFNETKDKILNDLYNSVCSDMITYYKFIHGKDEETFKAEMKPSEAKLDFKVDFYGRGMHHPRALHSEGHQDSMGLCLFLALYKKISQDKIQILILDDVVMSIDSNHRRNICKLIKTYFPDIQFFITTHNRTWARQLRSDGVVETKNMKEFRDWSVKTGPRYAEKFTAWEDIMKNLDDNEPTRAAQRLREHLEFVLENVCDGLRCFVPYKSDARYDFGDYALGAKTGYKAYLRMAKNAATSWNNKNEMEKYAELDSQFSEIVTRTQIDQWMINENVHYSKWDDFNKADLLPIIEAFQDFENIFRCQKCHGLISLAQKDLKDRIVKCPCGSITWNLEGKKG